MYKELKRTCTAIVRLIKPFFLGGVTVAVVVVAFLNSLMYMRTPGRANSTSQGENERANGAPRPGKYCCVGVRVVIVIIDIAA